MKISPARANTKEPIAKSTKITIITPYYKLALYFKFKSLPQN